MFIISCIDVVDYTFSSRLGSSTDTQFPSPAISLLIFGLSLPGISTLKTGEPCHGECDHSFIPYCKKCRNTTGDPSISVRNHERFGKMLCAERDLPKGYKAALWGDVVKEADMPDDDKEWGFEINDGL